MARRLLGTTHGQVVEGRGNSSREAELYALVNDASQTKGLLPMLMEFDVKLDGAACADVFAAHTAGGLDRTRHTDVQCFRFRMRALRSASKKNHVDTNVGLADILRSCSNRTRVLVMEVEGALDRSRRLRSGDRRMYRYVQTQVAHIDVRCSARFSSLSNACRAICQSRCSLVFDSSPDLGTHTLPHCDLSVAWEKARWCRSHSPMLSQQRSESDVSVLITRNMLEFRDPALHGPGSRIVVSYPGEADGVF